jgi:predicted nucleic-acid-binding protein
MIAIDTNVVVSLLTGDDPEQFKVASAAVQGQDLFLCKTVLLESEWVLRFSYRFSREAIGVGFGKLLGYENLQVARQKRAISSQIPVFLPKARASSRQQRILRATSRATQYPQERIPFRLFQGAARGFSAPRLVALHIRGLRSSRARGETRPTLSARHVRLRPATSTGGPSPQRTGR